MYYNRGIEKEMEMVKAIHNKKYDEMDNNIRFTIKKMFDDINNNDIFESERVEGFIKPDFFVRRGSETHFVSMKTGRASTLHEEDIKKFILYLRKWNISTRTQQTILLFQYGDRTMDGTGTNRLSHEKLYALLKTRINDANKELNENKELLLDVLDRIMFDGVSENKIRAEYIYHGTPEFGVTASREQIRKHVTRKNYSFLQMLHIGPILIKPKARYVGKEIKDPEKRNRVTLYWPNLALDLEYISERYNG